MSGDFAGSAGSRRSDGSSRGIGVRRFGGAWLLALFAIVLAGVPALEAYGCEKTAGSPSCATAGAASRGGGQAGASTGSRIASFMQIVWAPLELSSELGELTSSSARHWWAERSGVEKDWIVEGIARAVAVGASVVFEVLDQAATRTPVQETDSQTRIELTIG